MAVFQCYVVCALRRAAAYSGTVEWSEVRWPTRATEVALTPYLSVP